MLRPLLTAGGLVAGGLAAATAVSLTTGGSGTPTRALPDVVPTRQQQWARLRDNGPDNPYDVLIIGGGATGTGCAVDAATRQAVVRAERPHAWEPLPK
jgi:glycerol-3-phosphate dehydrogenase